MNKFLLVAVLVSHLFVLIKSQSSSCSSSYELNVDFKGNDLLSYPLFVPSVDLCCSGCSNFPTCMAWTYVPGNQACWLKNTTEVTRTISSGRLSGIIPRSFPTTTMSMTTPTTTFSTGSVTPTTTFSTGIVTPTTTFSTGVVTPTTTFSTGVVTPTTTFSPTITTSTTTTTTTASTTTTSTTTTTTTTTSTTTTTTTTSTTTTTTTVSTQSTPTTTTTSTTTTISTTAAVTTSVSRSGCFVEDNINYVGNDFFSTYVADVSECCNLCGRNSTCVVWTFLTEFRFCYLKNAPPSVQNRQAYTNAMSGVVTLR